VDYKILNLTMFDVLIRLRTSFKAPYIHIDGPVFRLHWFVTSSLLLVFSLFMITQQYMGTPVSCKSDRHSQTINQYCWIHSTYTVSTRNSYEAGRDFPHQGIGPEGNGRVQYLSYYKWVGFMLLFQSFMFYLPRYFWKSLEKGKIRRLVQNINLGLIPEGETKQQQKLLVGYLYDNLNRHESWSYWYYFCELLALLNVILQIILTNKFLNGVFLSLGIDILTPESSDMEEKYRPTYDAFPTTTKCLFTEYGPSGAERKIDALCILSLNKFIEYIYKFLWFWLFLLTLLSISFLIFRTVILVEPHARKFFLKTMFTQVEDGVVNTLVKNSKAGDWLLFNLLCKYLEDNMFTQVMKQLAGKLGNFTYDDQENLPLCETS